MVTSIKETYKDFFLFIKKPIDQPDPNSDCRPSIGKAFSILAIDIPVVGIIGIIIYFIEKNGLINSGQNSLNLLFKQLPLWKFILLGVVVNPFFEELVFRFYLRQNLDTLKNNSILQISTIKERSKIKFRNYLVYLWTKKFRTVFFFSALIFACFHLLNYQFSSEVVLLSPLLIAPQFISGLFLGYLRIKYNLLLGCIMHSIHNAFFISVSLTMVMYL